MYNCDLLQNIYLFISFENCFVSKDYETYVGRGLVINWLECAMDTNMTSTFLNILLIDI